MKTLSRFLQTFGLLLITLGAFFTYQHFNPSVLAFQHFTPSVQTLSPSAILPMRIEIPSIHVSLPIFPSRIYNNLWQTTNLGVSYLLDSPLPGDEGNSILYGHNWQSLLGSLPYVKPNDTITITYIDHSTKTFVVKYTQIVDPSDTNILHQSTDARITVYTCTGFLDSKRFVVVAVANKS